MRWSGGWGWWARAILLSAILLLSSGEPVPRRRRLFQEDSRRRRINIVTIQSEPYMRLKWLPGLIGNQRYEGYYVDLIDQVAGHVGFDFQLHLVADGKLGTPGDEGSWNGMVGELLRGTADLTLGPMSTTAARQEVVEFTMPIDTVHLTIVMTSGSRPTNTETLPQLLQHRDVIFAVIRDSDAADTLQRSTEPDVQSLWRRLSEQNNESFLGNIYEGLEYVRRGRYALILDSLEANYHTGRKPCDLVAIATIPVGRHYGFAARKGDHLLGEVNRSLEMLKSRTAEWRARHRKWWNSECPTADTDANSLMTESGTTGSAAPSTEGQPLQLKVITELNAPFVMTSEGDGSLVGYTIDLLSKMAAIVPFTYDMVFPADTKGLGRKRHGRWNGLTGQLLRQEADLAAVPFTSHRSRDRVLSYTKPFLHSTLSLLTRAPSSNDDIPIFLWEDLLNQTTYKYGVLRGSHLEKELKRSRDHVTRKIWENIRSKRRRYLLPSIEEGITRVRNGNFAFILPSTYATYISSKAPCDLMALDQFMFITNYMFAVRRGNTLVSNLDKALFKLQQDGVLQMLFHKWWNTGDCVGATDPNLQEIPEPNSTESGGSYQSSFEWMVNLFPLSKKGRAKTTTTGSTPPTGYYRSSTAMNWRSTRVGSNNENPTAPDGMTAETLTPIPSPIDRGEEKVEHVDNVGNPPHQFTTSTEAAAGGGQHPSHLTSQPDAWKDRNVSQPDQDHHRHRHHHSGSRGTTNSTLPPADVTQTPATTVTPRRTFPSPPRKWDGKYIFHDLYTTTPPSINNYSLELEVLPDGDDSIRIFPFTYKPRVPENVKPTGGETSPVTATGGGKPPVTATGGGKPPVTTTGGGKPPVTATGGGKPPVTATGETFDGETDSMPRSNTSRVTVAGPTFPPPLHESDSSQTETGLNEAVTQTDSEGSSACHLHSQYIILLILSQVTLAQHIILFHTRLL